MMKCEEKFGDKILNNFHIIACVCCAKSVVKLYFIEVLASENVKKMNENFKVEIFVVMK